MVVKAALLVAPGIEVFNNRAHYLKVTGSEAPYFNPDRDPRAWRYTGPLSGRRNINFANVPVLSRSGHPMLGPPQNPSPQQALFYRDFGILDVPQLDSLSISEAEVAQPNLPSERESGGPAAPLIPPPLRALLPDEAWYPSPFDTFRVVNIAAWREAYPRAADASSLDAIAAKLDALDAYLRSKLG